jgi:hypothetical protein
MNLVVRLGVVAALTVPAVAFAADPKAEAIEYVNANVVPMLKSSKAITDAVTKANAERSGWGEYSLDWKKWNPSEAAKQPDSYTKAEYRWSVQKDKTLRDQCTSGEAASAMKDVQDKSNGRIGEFFVVDAKGGNVAQTQLTSDWFQGDEDKFTKVAGKKDAWADEPKRDDTIGKSGVQVSVPLWDKDAFIGVAVVTVLVNSATASANP